MAVQSFVYVQYVARQFGDDAKCMYVVCLAQCHITIHMPALPLAPHFRGSSFGSLTIIYSYVPDHVERQVIIVCVPYTVSIYGYRLEKYKIGWYVFFSESEISRSW